MMEGNSAHDAKQKGVPASGDNLELRRWNEAWKSFWKLVASDLYGTAREHIAEDIWEPTSAELQLAEEFIERLCNDVGLDTEAWLAWVGDVNERLPSMGAEPDLSMWPEHLPTPPQEPQRASVKLVKLTTHSQLEGWASSWILYHLSLARAVRLVKRIL